MKKFRYNLENLLQVKLKLEDQVKIAYGNARQRLTKEEDKLKLLEVKKATYEDEQRKLRMSRLDLMKIKQTEEAIKIMKQKITTQASVVRNCLQRLEVVRIRLNDAMIERKIQEKLKEKAWEEYILEFEAEERKEVDELNSFQYSNPSYVEEDS